VSIIRTISHVTVSESWGQRNIMDSELAVGGFSMFRRDRKDRLSDGVLLYVRSIYTVHEVDDTWATGFDEMIYGV